MARRRGWGGDPPHSDEEATARIVTTAVELVSSTGAAISLADVANSLGVIRQTVYRYFPTSDALMHAVAMASVDAFLDRLSTAVEGIHDPAEAITEGTVFTLDEVTRTPHLGILLSESYPYDHSGALTSAEARAIGMRMIDRFDVDWSAHGYDETSLGELVEFTLRTMLSFFVAPNTDRTPQELRKFLRRWLGGAVAAQQAQSPR
ncbi:MULTISPECIES: TetR/AcrR family transcriptional regulator [Mycobacteriaceae]|uniref:TetR family transcriptional regulator n=1 Tax=Mycolicibacterium neoaurum VKM Ac-1815D TaxID=700508 RepID=V5XBM6_MYCNE|nr:MULTISPECIES: TetR/AcrR family transcriptional regulator [Mycobacteriaceae]AHC25046.1 TetR family transcriptional regulator [Mycolicibacterium neoaurum VKM Ac-1815D]AMO08245.1 TetR family transcriptional regulator [Mycolicibacterium neoaurum]AXK78424.1 TetR/AcrR family transcriptional regulator [Mycolicibacterium neoaurum]KJQ50864.1 TetR family transcriptional regulator [Mycolicibacterium neoaurum]KUM10072.1 TetR family transcriptional regulator [Mycolicibacterium neoaurum]